MDESAPHMGTSRFVVTVTWASPPRHHAVALNMAASKGIVDDGSTVVDAAIVVVGASPTGGSVTGGAVVPGSVDGGEPETSP